jgi:hypothetical protein
MPVPGTRHHQRAEPVVHGPFLPAPGTAAAAGTVAGGAELAPQHPGGFGERGVQRRVDQPPGHAVPRRAP